MWKRLHSKRDPDATIWRELHHEFAGYFTAGSKQFRLLAGNYPGLCFGLMVTALVISIVLSFTRFRHITGGKMVPLTGVSPIRDGAVKLLHATEKIKQTLILKHLVDSITAKRGLTQADSTVLDSALTELEKIRGRP